MTKRFARVPIAAATMKGEHALRVLIALCSFAGKSGQCWPSLATIASIAGLDRRKVPAALGKLISAGLVTKIATAAGRSATYQLHYKLTPLQVSALTPQEVSPNGATDTRRGVKVTPVEVTESAPTDTRRGALTDQDSEQTNEQTALLSPDGDGESSQIDLAFQTWNAMASEAGLPAVNKLTKPLRSSLKARLSEIGGINAWQATIERVRQSEFLCGGSQSGWRCSLQWLVKPSNFEKVVSGNYDNRAGLRGGPGGTIADKLAANIRKADGNE
jgi:hypothetical protein